MARRRYVSIKEVAAHAGVSFQTASKVLNGGDVRVSADDRGADHGRGRRAGYRPNTIARSLVQRATATIGLVASDATDVAIAQASVAAEQAARTNGHSVLVGHLAVGGADGADIVRTLIERRVDGIIAAAPEVEEDTEVAELLRRYVPSVSLQAVPGGGVPMVGSNHRETGRLAADHLVGLGHTSHRHGHRAVPAAGYPQPAARLRGRAARRGPGAERGPRGRGRLDAARRRGRDQAAARTLAWHHRDLRAQRHDGDRRAERAVADRAQGTRRCSRGELRRHTVRRYLTPPLTTVRVPLAETGRQAVELLLRSIAGEPVPERTPLLPVELIVRGSCGAQGAPSPRSRRLRGQGGSVTR